MKLVLMGDLHFPELDETIPGLADARDGFYRTFLGRFLEMDADAHISLGDLTNYGTPLELQGVYEILNSRDRNFYHVLGNHDLYAQPRKEVLKTTGQTRYHAIDTGRAVLAFLDTAKEMDHQDWGGWIDEAQLQWFEEVVKASGTKPLLVFAHHPIYKTTKRSEVDKGSIHPSIDMWQILNQKEGIGIYFNGHTHVDSIVKQENWTFVQLSACLDQPAFRVVDVGQYEVRVAAVDVTDTEVWQNAPIVYNHMNHFTHNPIARGTVTDRECTVLYK